MARGAKGSRPSGVLEGTTLAAVAAHIAHTQPQNVIVMTGAGISTSAGIPDFRSPESGLYQMLSQFDLDEPEDVFDIQYFRHFPEPFFALARELCSGAYNPTATHHFIRLLHEKGILLRNYTQNIDGLERVAGLPDDKVIEAHGTFATATCTGFTYKNNPAKTTNDEVKNEDEDEDKVSVAGSEESHYSYDSHAPPYRPHGCGRMYDEKWVLSHINAVPTKIPLCETCGCVVKPDIVFFGEDLPTRFYKSIEKDFTKCDLLIVMGTSLKVYPFAGLVAKANPKVPRLLINIEPVGLASRSNPSGLDLSGTSRHKRDAFHKGDCDGGCKELAKLLGWHTELDALIAEEKTSDRTDAGDKKVKDVLSRISASVETVLDHMKNDPECKEHNEEKKELDKIVEDIKDLNISKI